MRFTRGRLSLAPFQRVYEEKIFEAAKAASISIFPSNARKYWLSRKDAHERKFQERDAGLSNVLLASPSMIPRGNILPRLVGGGVITVARERSLERLLHVSWAFHRPTILVQVEPRDERRISSSRSPGWPSPFFFTLFVFPPPPLPSVCTRPSGATACTSTSTPMFYRGDCTSMLHSLPRHFLHLLLFVVSGREIRGVGSSDNVFSFFFPSVKLGECV